MIENIQRWNFDADDESILVCKGHHEKHDDCEAHMERLCPHEALKIINELRRGYLSLESKIRGFAN